MTKMNVTKRTSADKIADMMRKGLTLSQIRAVAVARDDQDLLRELRSLDDAAGVLD